MDRWNGMYLELMVRTMERLTMKTMGMIKIPSNIVASTGKSKVQLIVEAKAHKDVLDLWNIINITITTITITITTLTAPTREENLCFLNHHHDDDHHQHHKHQQDVPNRAARTLVRFQKPDPRLLLAKALLTNQIKNPPDHKRTMMISWQFKMRWN